jgi:hypothetical protein
MTHRQLLLWNNNYLPTKLLVYLITLLLLLICISSMNISATIQTTPRQQQDQQPQQKIKKSTLQWFMEDFLPYIIHDKSKQTSSTSKSTRVPKLLVLAGGLSRTGTMSTQKALEMLGYKVLHGGELIKYGLMHTSYLDALTNTYAMNDFIDQILDMGFNATLDIQSAVLLPEFLERFPDAKVLLTTRDSAETWAKSFEEARDIWALLFLPPWSWLAPLKAALLGMDRFMGDLHRTRFKICPPDSWLWYVPWYRPCYVGMTFDGGSHVDYYYHFNQRVRDTVVKKENLLEFNVKQGWAPLEKFLGKKHNPDSSIVQPFPNVNESEEIKRQQPILFFGTIAWPFIALISFRFIAKGYLYITDMLLMNVGWGKGKGKQQQ